MAHPAPLVVARLAGMLGDRASIVVLPVLAVQSGAGVGQAAFLFAVQTAPGLLAVLVGRPADRSSRLVEWCLAADVARALVLVAAAVAGLSGTAGWGWLLAVALLSGAGGVLFDVGLQGQLPRVASGAGLVRLNGWFARVQSVAEIAGPALGGLVVVGLAPAGALGVVAGCFAASALVLLPAARVHRTGAPGPVPGRPGPPGWGGGLAVLRADAPLRSVVVVALLMNAGGAVIAALWTAHTTAVLDVPADTLGLLTALGGVSAVAASAVAGRWVVAHGGLRCSAVALPPALLALWCIPLASWAPAVASLAVFQVVFSGCAVVAGVATATLRQQRTPAHAQAQVYAVIRSAQAAVLPLMGVLAAVVAGGWGSTAACVVGCVIAASAAPLLVRMRTATLTPAPPG